jgi:hypothetical protein
MTGVIRGNSRWLVECEGPDRDFDPRRPASDSTRAKTQVDRGVQGSENGAVSAGGGLARILLSLTAGDAGGSAPSGYAARRPLASPLNLTLAKTHRAERGAICRGHRNVAAQIAISASTQCRWQWINWEGCSSRVAPLADAAQCVGH